MKSISNRLARVVNSESTILLPGKYSIAATCAVALLLTACGQEPASEEPTLEEPVLEAAQPALTTDSVLDTVQPDEVILATVNGTRIGDQDLSINMVRTLGDSYAQFIDSSVEEKILQSMISSRAIAAEALSLMTENDKIALEKRVALFREELLVKDYLLNNADPHTITSAQIETYYNDNPQEFQGQEERLYELVTVSRSAYKQSSQQALETLQLAKTHDDWRSLSAQLRREQKEIGLSHSYESLQLVGDEDLAASNLSSIDNIVKTLNIGQMSRVIVQDNAPYLVRLLEIKTGEPVPLSQARAAIKKKLLPASVRKSVREVSDTILAKSEVVVIESAQNSQ